MFNLEQVKKSFKEPVFWLKFSAYAIPFSLLLYVLYWNFLPFGYHKSFTIEVGSEGDTSGEFHLEPSRDLSERKTAPDGTTYRELKGSANAVFEPTAVLKDAMITASVEGDGVSILTPSITFDPSSVKWDYAFDFTKKETLKEFTGNAFVFDGATYFDGKSVLEMPNTPDKFESGPFTVFAKWEPKDSRGTGQQIVGHFNWELWQNKDSVSFQVGRMNDAKGQIYSIKYPVTPDFFNTTHTALAVYNPAKNGYIELFVDGNFAGRTYFGSDTIWKDYNGKQNLTLGWAKFHNYGKNAHFKGSLYELDFVLRNVLPPPTETIFETKNNDSISISLISTATSTIKNIRLNVVER